MDFADPIVKAACRQYGERAKNIVAVDYGEILVDREMVKGSLEKNKK